MRPLPVLALVILAVERWVIDGPPAAAPFVAAILVVLALYE